MKVNWIIYFWDSASLCSSDYPWILHLSASNSWGLGFQSFTTTSVSFTFEEWKFHISFTSAELSSPSSGKKTWSLKITSYFYSFFFYSYQYNYWKLDEKFTFPGMSLYLLLLIFLNYTRASLIWFPPTIYPDYSPSLIPSFYCPSNKW